MTAKPLLIKPEPIEYIKVENEVQFTKDTHDKIKKYLSWNHTLDNENDFNFFLEGAVKYFLENDTEFKKYLKQQSKPTRKKTILSKNNNTNIEQNSSSENINSTQHTV